MVCLIPCIEEGCKENTEVISADSGHEHGQDAESCTPFCIDHCCTPHVIFQEAADLMPFATKYFSTVSVHFSLGPYLSVPSSVWQPPKNA